MNRLPVRPDVLEQLLNGETRTPRRSEMIAAAVQLAAWGWTRTEIAVRLGVTRRTVYRLLADAQ